MTVPSIPTGRRFDKEIGLYYYRARYYNPYTGRFLQTDPIGYTEGMNLYIYTSNNPLVHTDSSGCSEENSNEPNWQDECATTLSGIDTQVKQCKTRFLLRFPTWARRVYSFARYSAWYLTYKITVSGAAAGGAIGALIGGVPGAAAGAAIGACSGVVAAFVSSEGVLYVKETYIPGVYDYGLDYCDRMGAYCKALRTRGGELDRPWWKFLTCSLADPWEMY